MIGRKLHAKQVADGFDMPTYAHEGDAGLDLRITETVTLEPMQKCVVGCGLAVEIPSGCVGLLFPRRLVVMPYVPCELVPVDELNDTERGAGGFGSTGIE